MDDNVDIFVSIFTTKEWNAISKDSRSKLHGLFNTRLEESLTAKALLQTTRSNAERDTEDLKQLNRQLLNENEALKSRLEATQSTLSELETRLSATLANSSKLQSQCNQLEADVAEFRHQRNVAVDEKNEHMLMLQRRNAEIERLQVDLTELNKQMETAIAAKCHLLSQADEIESTKLRLEYKEKRLDQERQLLQSQMESITQDLNARTEEILNMRRDNTSRCIQLETKLSEKSEELVVAKDHIQSLTTLNQTLAQRVDELSDKLSQQRDSEFKMGESYTNEIDAKTKLVNAYKSMFEENQKHAEQLKQSLSEVQEMLNQATEQYGELETKHKEAELSYEEVLTKKNECIALLKKELEMAKEMSDTFKREQYQRDNGVASPNSSSNILKSTSVTEVYSQYLSTSEKLIDSQKEVAQLKNYISNITEEIEEKGPYIRRMKEEYLKLIEGNDTLKETNENLLSEVQQLRNSNSELSRLEGVIARENARYKKEIADLSRQVCHLLQEIDNYRAGSGSSGLPNDIMDISESLGSADGIITKKLVTFSDISELQKNNQKLLAVVRELTARQEEVESFDPAAVADLKKKLETLQDDHKHLLDELERQTKIITTLNSQRDMYKNLYAQATRNVITTNGIDDTSPEDSQLNQLPHHDSQRCEELQSQIEKLKRDLEAALRDSESYRKEKTLNDKVMEDQLEKFRAEIKELVKLNSKLSTQLENNDERFKIQQNNVDVYRKQILALEKQNKIYNDTIIKHEQSIRYLKDETLQAQTRLSKAEAMLGNLEKENALLRDTENRLLKERDNLQREQHTQHLIQTNIELIKATLERTDAESKLRLDTRLDEANRECAALRRRMQEEQDRFRELSDHMKQQVETAKLRITEEENQSAQLREELKQLRHEITQKSSDIEDLTQKLKISAIEPNCVSSTSSEDSKRIYALEHEIKDLQNEIQTLRHKLELSKNASDQYCTMAKNAEEDMKNYIEQNEKLQREIKFRDDEIANLREKCSELEGEVSILMEDNTVIPTKRIEEELNIKTMDLQTAREQLESTILENKHLQDNLKSLEKRYAQEVLMHSTDLQSLASLKANIETYITDLNKVRQEKECLMQQLQENQNSWSKQEEILKRQMEELRSRFKGMEEHNNLLLDQVQGLNTQLTVLQVQQSQDTSLDTSLNLDGNKAHEQLLSVIKFLRQEKDIAVSKAEIVEAEYERLKKQFENTETLLKEAKSVVEAERQKSEVAVVTAAKHSEVLRKVETLNAITDSNRALRQERDTLKVQIEELRTKCEQLESKLAPLQDTNREVSKKAEAMQTENVSLRGECNRWRQRAHALIEKSNRTNPEDWKKLQNERDTLAKQLTVERGITAKLNDELNHLKADKIKVDEQLKSLRGQNNNLSDDIGRFKDEISSLQTQITDVSKALDDIRNENTNMKEQNRIITEDMASKDVHLNDIKNNLAAVRKIAKKYKIQCEDQSKELTALKDNDQLKVLTDKQTELNDRISEMDRQHKELVDSLNAKIKAATDDNINYKKEIESLKVSAMEREDRFKQIFKNAKDRIVTLTEQNHSLHAQLGLGVGSGDQSAVVSITMPTDGDPVSEMVVETNNSNLSTSAEKPITMDQSSNDLLEKIDTLQKEKVNILAEKQQDLDKHTMEIETLMQTINKLQRQVEHHQHHPKPSTSTSTSVEKASNESPPTANIKPMAGGASVPSAVVASGPGTSPLPQSVSIHPWRAAPGASGSGEPPLASVRPTMSTHSQPRTVTVLPYPATGSSNSSGTSSTSSAAAVVPPQQAVHTTASATASAPTSSSMDSITSSSSSSATSSHIDNVPSTSGYPSSSVGGSSAGSALQQQRQVAVPPTQSSQDTILYEEPDEDMVDQDQTGTNAQQQSLQTVALVSPRVETPPTTGTSGPTSTAVASGVTNSSSVVPCESGTSAGLTQRAPDQGGAVTTTGGVKRQREFEPSTEGEADDGDDDDDDDVDTESVVTVRSGTNVAGPQTKRARKSLPNQKHPQKLPKTQHAGGSKLSATNIQTSQQGMEVEYQVPTSSQRDQDDDNVIVLESDEEAEHEDEEVDEEEEVGEGVGVVDDDDDEEGETEEDEEEDNEEEEDEDEEEQDVQHPSDDDDDEDEDEEDDEADDEDNNDVLETIYMDMDEQEDTTSRGNENSNQGNEAQQQYQDENSVSEEGDIHVVDDNEVVGGSSVPASVDEDNATQGTDPNNSNNEAEVTVENTFEVPHQSENDSLKTSETTETTTEDTRSQQTEATSSGAADGTGRSVPNTPLQSSPQESLMGTVSEDAINQSGQSKDSDGNSSTAADKCMRPPISSSTTTTSSTSNAPSASCKPMGESDTASNIVSDAADTKEATASASATNSEQVDMERHTPEKEEEEGREAEASPSTRSTTRQQVSSSSGNNSSSTVTTSTAAPSLAPTTTTISSGSRPATRSNAANSSENVASVRGMSTARRSGRQIDARGGSVRKIEGSSASSSNMSASNSGMSPTPIVWAGSHRHSHSDGMRSNRNPNMQSNYTPRGSRRSRGRSRPYGRF